MLSLLAVLSSGWAAPTELTIWHSYRGDERTALEQLLTEYDEAHPEIRVVPLALPYDSFVTKLESAAPRGNGPDLFISAHERIGSWVGSGMLAPADPSLAAAYHPVTVDALTYEDQMWGVPLAS